MPLRPADCDHSSLWTDDAGHNIYTVEPYVDDEDPRAALAELQPQPAVLAESMSDTAAVLKVLFR